MVIAPFSLVEVRVGFGYIFHIYSRSIFPPADPDAEYFGGRVAGFFQPCDALALRRPDAGAVSGMRPPAAISGECFWR